VTDGHGHGTHVTGTIAAATDNALGIAGIVPGVSVIPVKVLADNGYGSFSDIMDGMDWARANGADIISMSLGGTMDASSAAYFQQFIDDEYAAGITIVAAAGNGGSSALSYPASFTHVISVAATDNAGNRASFSQYNWAVDVAAPGVGTMSTLPGGTYAAWNGTSMATPHVAAVAAMVRSVHPDWSVDQVEAAVVLGATDKGAAGRDDPDPGTDAGSDSGTDAGAGREPQGDSPRSIAHVRLL
jgi:serine protease